jgi:crotonobetainyl-CoA:carnitine CoA-transferase CaiB-like acyl-CoA transferase
MRTNDSRVRAAAPCLGADTDPVLREACGYDDPTIARLRAAGVLS